MIKIKDLIDIPSLNYHVEHGLTLHENVYRYSSEKFISLFKEAREALRDGKIQLNEEDLELLESTDIGEYGEYEGKKVPLDLPMLNEEVITSDKMLTVLSIIDGKRNLANDQISQLFKDNVGGTFYIYTNEEGEYENLKPISKQDAFKYIDYYNSRLKKDYKKEEKLGAELGVLGIESELLFNKEEFKTDPSVFSVNEEEIDEAEYRGKNVPLNKPKRGGSKKFVVYTKNAKGNVVKVNFGGTTGLNVKIDEPGARASFAARHKCAQKKDKTKPGYWACNIGRYWKSLGGKRNFSGYW